MLIMHNALSQIKLINFNAFVTIKIASVNAMCARFTAALTQCVTFYINFGL